MDSYPLVRKPNNTVGDLLMVVSDAFQPLKYWNGFMNDHSKYTGVALDRHAYDLFSDAQVAKSYSQHISVSTCSC